MSSNTEAAKEKAAEIGAEVIARLIELGGRGLEGLFSSPWTGVPTALIIMSQIDPSGKLTKQFLSNLASFLSAIGVMLGQSIQTGLQDIAKTVIPKQFIPRVDKTITPYLIIAGPWTNDTAGAILANTYLVEIYLPFKLSGGDPVIITGSDGQLYVVDKGKLAA